MLFHITQTYSPTNCSAHDPERQAAFRQTMATAADRGVQIKGAYVDGLGHSTFIVVEAESALALARVFYPVLEFGHYNVRPVVAAGEFMDAMAPGEE